MPNSNKILSQLRILVQLTQAEAQIAQVRITQARIDAVRRELTHNASNARECTTALRSALRELGGVPDWLPPRSAASPGWSRPPWSRPNR